MVVSIVRFTSKLSPDEVQLARSIPEAYRVEGAATIELADVSLVVRPDRASAPTR